MPETKEITFAGHAVDELDTMNSETGGYTLAKMAHEAGNKLVAELQALHADNPDGLTADQKATETALREAAIGKFEQSRSYKEVGEAQHASAVANEARQDLLGMMTTGEAQAVPAIDHVAMIRQMAGWPAGNAGRFPVGTPGATKDLNGVELSQSRYRRFRQMVAQGAGARDVVRQAISTAAGSFGNSVPTIIETMFFDRLFTINGIRKAGAEVLTTTGGESRELVKAADAALGAFTRNSTNVSTLQTAEGAALAERDPSMAVVETAPRKYTAYTRVSRELVEDSAVDIESMIGRILGRSISRLSELAYAQGRGSNNEPDGWNRQSVVDSTAYSGTGNARRITTAGSNVVAYADLVKVPYAVDEYDGMEDPVWLMHKGTIGEIFGIVGTDGHPVFRMVPYSGGFLEAPEGMLLGYPIRLATYCGRAATDNDIIAMFGSMDSYLIRDVDGVELRRWDQAQYLTDQVDFTARLRTDGKFINADQFSWLKAKA